MKRQSNGLHFDTFNLLWCSNPYEYSKRPHNINISYGKKIIKTFFYGYFIKFVTIPYEGQFHCVRLCVPACFFKNESYTNPIVTCSYNKLYYTGERIEFQIIRHQLQNEKLEKLNRQYLQYLLKWCLFLQFFKLIPPPPPTTLNMILFKIFQIYTL